MSNKFPPIPLFSLISAVLYPLFDLLFEQLFIYFLYPDLRGFTIPFLTLYKIPSLITHCTFIFLIGNLFLKEFSDQRFSLRNLLFAGLLPFLYLVSQKVIILLFSLLTLPIINNREFILLIQSIYIFRLNTESFLSIILFLLVINFIIPPIFRKNRKTPQSSNPILLYSLLIAIMIVMTSSLHFSNLFSFILLPNFNSAPYFNLILFLLLTMMLIGYFTTWSYKKLQALPSLQLDNILRICFKICFLLLFFSFIWKKVAETILLYGKQSFILELNNLLTSPLPLQITNVGFSGFFILLSLPLCIFTAQTISPHHLRHYHYGGIISLFSLLLYDAIKWQLPLKLILFQSALFLFSSTLFFAILALLFPKIWQFSTKHLAHSNIVK